MAHRLLWQQSGPLLLLKFKQKRDDSRNKYTFRTSVPKEATGCSAKALPTGMYLRRPLTGTPVPNFDLRWV